MCSASLLFQVLTGMGKQCLSRSFLESTSRARSFEFPHRVHCLKILHWTSRGWFSLVCILQHFINSLESSCKLDGRSPRPCVASTAFGLGVAMCVWGGGGWLRFRAYSVSTRDDRPVSVCVNVVDVCETVWVCAVHVCMFALFLFARMACCLTALAGVSVLAW